MKFAIKVFGRALICAAAAVVVAATPAGAQFYKGKNITMVVNSPPGGPTDIEARLFARHIEKHIPGDPNIVVRNMGGGGTVIGNNYLGEVARKDGYTMGFLVTLLSIQLLGDPGLRVDFGDFQWIGGLENTQVCYIRKDTPPGINTPADIVKAKEFKTAGVRKTASLDIRLRLTLDLLGVPYHHISGHRGLAQIRLAVRQNEAQMSCASVPGFKANIMPVLVKPGIAIPAYYFQVSDGEGHFPPAPRISEAPGFYDLYNKVKGKPPSGLKWDAFVLINDTASGLQRGVVLPPGAPKEALQILRKAFEELRSDKAYLSDYAKTAKIEPILVSAAQAQRRIRQVKDADPKVIKFLREYTGLKR